MAEQLKGTFNGVEFHSEWKRREMGEPHDPETSKQPDSQTWRLQFGKLLGSRADMSMFLQDLDFL